MYLNPGTRQAGARAVGQLGVWRPATHPAGQGVVHEAVPLLDEERNFNAVLQPVLLRRIDRSVIGGRLGAGRGVWAGHGRDLAAVAAFG